MTVSLTVVSMIGSIGSMRSIVGVFFKSMVAIGVISVMVSSAMMIVRLVPISMSLVPIRTVSVIRGCSIVGRRVARFSGD